MKSSYVTLLENACRHPYINRNDKDDYTIGDSTQQVFEEST